MSVERTLILVKPDGVRRNLIGEVIRRVETKGYNIVALKMVQADRSILAVHYAEHEGNPFYEPLVDVMMSGPVVALIAPGTIRGDLARDQGTKVVQNIVHGSDSPESASREIGIWFAADVKGLA